MNTYSAFIRLLRTDFRNVRTQLLYTLSIYAIVHAVFLLLIDRLSFSEYEVWFTVVNAMTGGSALVSTLVISMTIWASEWKGGQHLLLLTLPIHRGWVYLSKVLVALMTGTVLLGVFVLLFMLEARTAFGVPTISDVLSLAPRGAIFTNLFALVTIVLLGSFSFLLGKAVRRASGFVTFATFVLLLNAPTMLSFMLADRGGVIQSVVGLPGSTLFLTVDNVTTVYVALPLAVNAALSVLYVLGSIYLLNRRVQS
ncbi:hypothetical protein [Paenibacillus sp. YYML68]|uniref:hypothetical protein n=1 Tax=Paenibacillus sp. YYML68 TaxID=2909250 RepID=UPI00249275CD|nr:hypothetical protein [Paenibacillus sp. YYML68]